LERSRTSRHRVAVAVLGAVAAVAAAGCTRPGGQPPRTTTTTTPTGPDTTMPGGDHMDHGGDDHGNGGAHSIPPRLNHPPTEAQRATAMKLVEDNKKINAARFATMADARKAGYIEIGDGMSGVSHFEHPIYRRDGRELDLQYPEALVYRTATQRLTTVMYILEPGKTMNDVPDIAGNLTVWHGHGDLCWKSTNPDDPNYLRLDGVAVGGRCIGGGTLRVEPPMLHLWVTDNPCGPFAGTDPGNRTGSCSAH
jgi:hypothetical protein